MTLGIVVFGAAFLVGLGLGTYTRRPLSTAFLVLGSFTALLVLSATGEVLSAAAILVIVALVGLVAESMRETFALLVGRYDEGEASLAPTLGSSGRGGTGRRDGLRTRWASALGGSSPPARTRRRVRFAYATDFSAGSKRSRRKSPMSWRVRPSSARSARISPTTEQNL